MLAALMGCGASAPQAKPAPAGAKPVAQKPPPVFVMDRKPLLEEAFLAMDTDGDGVVEMSEFVALSRYDDDASVQQQLFSFMDKDSNGTLSLEEWTAGIAAQNIGDVEFTAEMKKIISATQSRKREAALGASANEQPTSKSKVERREMLERVFKVMDDDGNGVVDMKEFLVLTFNFGDKDMTSMIFKMMDKDGNGKLELEEWVAGVANLSLSDEDFEREMNNVLAAAPKAAEAAVAVSTWGKSVFAQFDTDKTGTISSKELSRALKALPKTKPASLPSGAKLMSVDEMIAVMDSNGDGEIDEAEWLANLAKCPSLAAALAENVNADGEIAAFRSFEQQKAKREGEIAELEAKAERTPEEEETMQEYKRQVESLSAKIEEAKANEAAKGGA